MSDIIPFTFENSDVRAVHRDGDPWFVAKDVCKALGIVNSSDAMDRLDNDEKDDVGLTDAIGRKQEFTVINESGLYILILRSRNAVKPGTLQHRFRKWVTSEVLPAIRKTGRFESERDEYTPDNRFKHEDVTRRLELDAREAALLAKEKGLLEREVELLNAWNEFHQATIDDRNTYIHKKNEIDRLRKATIKALVTHSTLSNVEINDVVNEFEHHQITKCVPEIVSYHRRAISEEEAGKAPTSH